MKKLVFSLAALALLLVSCQTQEKDFVDEKVTAPEIVASVEIDSATRTLIDVDQLGEGTIYWTPADEINIFYGNLSTHYTSQNTANATTAVFRTTDVIGSTESASTNIWGLYPYDANATSTGSAISTTLLATQYGVPETFDDDLFITLAHSNSTALKFYNVCGGIKFSLSRGDITSIMFKGNNNEPLAGDISLVFENGLPKATVVNGLTEITLTPKTGTTFAQSTNYYIVALPGTLTGGFTMTFTTSGGAIGTFNYTTGAVSIKRSIFSKKADIDTYASFVDPPQPNNEIWYTSTYNQKIIPDSNSQWNSDIISNENVNGHGVIRFSTAITRIPNSAFTQCSGLVSISLPNSVLSIGSGAFTTCSSLQEISIPTSVTSIESYAFANCTQLSSIILPPDLTAISSSLFTHCFALESVTIPNDVTSIGQEAFENCRSLVSLTIPDGVTTIGYYPFDGCTSLKKVTFLSSNPLNNNSGIFDDIPDCRIFVPLSSINSYKTAIGWASYSNRIYAIPEYVDLGLSVKWAKFNLGASSPEDYGDYFAWGETEPYYRTLNPLYWKNGKSAGYAWESYQFNPSGDGLTFTKYTGSDYETLLNEDDAATVIWGDGWRIPTHAEWTALQNEDNFTWEWTSDYNGTGVAGRIVTSKISGYVGNSIFLPAAGVRANTILSFDGRQGWYWTSTHKGRFGFISDAWGSYFSSGMIDDNNCQRYDGQPIRPVCD